MTNPLTRMIGRLKESNRSSRNSSRGSDTTFDDEESIGSKSDRKRSSVLKRASKKPDHLRENVTELRSLTLTPIQVRPQKQGKIVTPGDDRFAFRTRVITVPSPIVTSLLLKMIHGSDAMDVHEGMMSVTPAIHY